MREARKPPRFAPPGSEWHPLETLGLVLLAGLAFLMLLLWATGEIAGRLFGGDWPGTTASDMGAVLVELGSHPGDPSAAWPTGQGTLIPGPFAFYGVLVALLLPVFTVAVLILRRRRDRKGNTDSTAARWAKPSDLRPLRVDAPEPRRLTLGRVDGKLVAAEPRQSAIVIGPVQTGKTSGFAIPAILEWQGPVVATSVKTDLMRETLAARSSIDGAETFVYDPTQSTGMPGCVWTPLSDCGTWQGAQRVASWLVSAVQRSGSGIENPEFWYASAAKLLAPVLFAAATSDRSMTDVVRWIDLQSEEDVRWALEAADDLGALAAFAASTLRDERTRSGVYTTAETVLAAYADPGVLASAMTSAGDPLPEDEDPQMELDFDGETALIPPHELRAERLLDGGWHTAYICAPAHEQRRLQPLFGTLIQGIIAAAFARSHEIGGPLDPPLLLVLDECANIAPIRELAGIASTGAGQGIQLVSVFQDMAQIAAVYGRDSAPTIVSNHRAKIILSGIADAGTHEYVGRMLGETEVRQTASTSGAEGRSSKTESVMYRSIAPANALREMPPGQGLLIYGHLPPARLSLRPWFRDKALTQLANPTPVVAQETR
jgi:type IV secretion system protein VirD4